MCNYFLRIGSEKCNSYYGDSKKISDCGRGRVTGGRIKRQRRTFLGQWKYSAWFYLSSNQGLILWTQRYVMSV